MKTKLTFIIITLATLFVTCGSPKTDSRFDEAISDLLAEVTTTV